VRPIVADPASAGCTHLVGGSPVTFANISASSA